MLPNQPHAPVPPHHQPVSVMQTEHVQRFEVRSSRTREFCTVPLDPQYHWYYINDLGTASMQQSVHPCYICLHQWRAGCCLTTQWLLEGGGLTVEN